MFLQTFFYATTIDLILSIKYRRRYMTYTVSMYSKTYQNEQNIMHLSITLSLGAHSDQSDRPEVTCAIHTFRGGGCSGRRGQKIAEVLTSIYIVLPFKYFCIYDLLVMKVPFPRL